MNQETIESLIQIYKNLKEEQAKLKSEGINDYNLITSLLKKSDEVRVHSRFLKSMLNPKGLHYRGPDFLELFLNLYIPEGKRPNAAQCSVYAEKDKIDLLIEDGEKYVIIENKIYAADQPFQITRYIDIVLKKEASPENITVVYLSLNGKDPSSVITSDNPSPSCGGFEIKKNAGKNHLAWLDDKEMNLKFEKLQILKDIEIPLINLSYTADISRWIDECLKSLLEGPANENTDNIVFALNEYKNVLKMFGPKKGYKKMPDFLQKIDEFILNNKDRQDDLYDTMAGSYRCFEEHASKRLVDALRQEFSDIKITSNHGDGELEKAVKDWIKRTGTKDEWRDVKLELESKTKCVLLLGVVNAYLTDQDGKVDPEKSERIDLPVRDVLKGAQQLNEFIEHVKCAHQKFLSK